MQPTAGPFGEGDTRVGFTGYNKFYLGVAYYMLEVAGYQGIVTIQFTFTDGKVETDTIEYYFPAVCFAAGTKVLTENGLKNIENIQAGDKVYSRNIESGKNELKTVLNTSERETKVDTYKIYVNGECIESTGNHPYYVKDKGFVEAKDLVVGDILIDVNNNEKTIGSIEIVKNSQTIKVYNMNVEDNHNYFVGDIMILVHNASCAEYE